MKCEVCGKKKATVHLTELVDGQMTELHICETCAKEKSVEMEQQFGLADLLAGLSDFGQTAKPAQAAAPLMACEHCSTSYEDFKKYGRLGCSECYKSFEGRLEQLLKKIHGANRHIGKVPLRLAKEQEQKGSDIDEIRKKLQEAVIKEDYEQAAILRDKIRSMEQKERGAE